MNEEFWHERWEKDQIGFHEVEANPLLVRHLASLKLKKGDRIFLPLCGKTTSIPWLEKQGYKVVGIELSKIAIDQFFEALGRPPTIEPLNKLTRYVSNNIEIFAGNIFDLTQDVLGTVDGIYDRGALVALPNDMRHNYVQHIMSLAGVCSQLVITYEYHESLMDGPPFSIDESALNMLYGDKCEVSRLETTQAPFENGSHGSLETAWLLTTK